MGAVSTGLKGRSKTLQGGQREGPLKHRLLPPYWLQATSIVTKEIELHSRLAEFDRWSYSQSFLGPQGLPLPGPSASLPPAALLGAIPIIIHYWILGSLQMLPIQFWGFRGLQATYANYATKRWDLSNRKKSVLWIHSNSVLLPLPSFTLFWRQGSCIIQRLKSCQIWGYPTSAITSGKYLHRTQDWRQTSNLDVLCRPPIDREELQA